MESNDVYPFRCVLIKAVGGGSQEKMGYKKADIREDGMNDDGKGKIISSTGLVTCQSKEKIGYGGRQAAGLSSYIHM